MDFLKSLWKHLFNVKPSNLPLDLSGASDGQFIFFRQLVHTQNGDDVLNKVLRISKYYLERDFTWPRLSKVNERQWHNWHISLGGPHLQRFVVLQNLLDSSGASVVLGSDDVGVEDTGGGIERIDSGVNSQLGDTCVDRESMRPWGEEGTLGVTDMCVQVRNKSNRVRTIDAFSSVLFLVIWRY